MRLAITLHTALKALARNGMRTALTMLGIIIGVAAVITMVALGRGAQSAIEEQVRSAGTNIVTVLSGNRSVGGVNQGSGASTALTAEDADAIRELPNVAYVAAGVSTRSQVIAASLNWQTRIEGTDVDLPAIRSWAMRSGDFFTAQDVQTASKIAVLGGVVSDQLFGAGVDPTNEIVRINNQPFRVVGVMASKGAGSNGQDQDDVVFVPYTTVQKRLLGSTSLQNITVSATTASSVESVSRAITELLRVRHRIQPGGADDFMVRTLEELASMRSATTETMTLLLSGIAAISLLVGGIGIMNIMLVSVTERTREIGVRLAVGAKKRHVLQQFLIESVVISLVGGLIGVTLGFALSGGLTYFLSWPADVSPSAVAISFAFSAGVGVFFGLYPASKASALNPIDALKRE